MSRRTNPYKEADRQRCMADRVHKQRQQILNKSLKLAMVTAMSAYKPPSSWEMGRYNKPWHGVSKPRVKACEYIAMLIGAKLRTRSYNGASSYSTSSMHTPAVTNNNTVLVHINTGGSKFEFATMQDAAAWLLAEYTKQKEAISGPNTERV